MLSGGKLINGQAAIRGHFRRNAAQVHYYLSCTAECKITPQIFMVF
jgi:hypothetical protein